jgi:hypothetical protein
MCERFYKSEKQQAQRGHSTLKPKFYFCFTIGKWKPSLKFCPVQYLRRARSILCFAYIRVCKLWSVWILSFTFNAFPGFDSISTAATGPGSGYTDPELPASYWDPLPLVWPRSRTGPKPWIITVCFARIAFVGLITKLGNYGQWKFDQQHLSQVHI